MYVFCHKIFTWKRFAHLKANQITLKGEFKLTISENLVNQHTGFSRGKIVTGFGSWKTKDSKS